MQIIIHVIAFGSHHFSFLTRAQTCICSHSLIGVFHLFHASIYSSLLKLKQRHGLIDLLYLSILIVFAKNGRPLTGSHCASRSCRILMLCRCGIRLRVVNAFLHQLVPTAVNVQLVWLCAVVPWHGCLQILNHILQEFALRAGTNRLV